MRSLFLEQIMDAPIRVELHDRLRRPLEAQAEGTAVPVVTPGPGRPPS
jgi:hypothetical protein